jgi:Nose resistant-to-fluoxetine protein, N-terminal domain
VYDANGQIPAGILSGNVNSAGDFQECLSVESESINFRGKHCIAELQPFVTETAPYLNHLRKLAQSFDMMKSNFDDVSTQLDCHQKSIIIKPNLFYSPHMFSVDSRQLHTAFVFLRPALITTLKRL